MSCTFFGRSPDFRGFNSRLIASAPSRVMGILSDAIGASDRGAARNEYGRTPHPWGPGRVRATFARCGASVNGDRIDPRGVAAIDRWSLERSTEYLRTSGRALPVRGIAWRGQVGWCGEASLLGRADRLRGGGFDRAKLLRLHRATRCINMRVHAATPHR